MNVIEAFRQWYSQLNPNDQQALYAFFVEWLSTQTAKQVSSKRIGFSGRTAPPVTANTIGNPNIIICKNCGAENKI